MEYRKIGHTDIDVSVICLGTMTWGEQNSETEAHTQLDFALDHGVSFIDTAEMYPVPPMASTYTLTEQYIGSWLKKRQDRDKIILASKVSGPGEWVDYIREGHICFDRKNIEAALDASLKRLNTDYIDLYQLHWPDRNTNFFGQLGFNNQNDIQGIAIEETLSVLADLVSSGKIRHIGISNETPWGMMQFLNIAEKQGWPRIVSIQNPYSLLNRTFEVGLSEISHRENIGLLAYSPLGFGVLSGKYLDGKQPTNARLTLFERFTRYNSANSQSATAAYVNIARNHGLDPAQMALAFVNSRPFVTSNIIGATNLDQLKNNISSVELSLSNEVMLEIEAVHEQTPNPSP